MPFHPVSRSSRLFRSVALLGLAGLLSTGVGSTKEALPGSPPDKAVVLFSGKKDDMEKNWVRSGGNDPANWKIEDGAMVSQGGDIATREKFENFMLHIEFRVPLMPEAHGQERGNSGIFLQGLYEIQVLDSLGIDPPGRGDCGAIYNQKAPLVNACKPPKEWQSYDMIYRAPRFGAAGDEVELPRVTIFQNGQLIHNNDAILRPTSGGPADVFQSPGPLRLQFHGNTVAYRNIWIVPLPAKGADEKY
jgi:hypothetical protein